ncbi:protein of unknown function [Magnetospirillum sp. XM-1]|uniref:hypothetical protein n=1 Tax=Magnetospirillum sp. XM-1 TaxID=1663591 RepID=UPI00073DFFFC|nr:hypothetical protein [Magnetospirillum sp. XM-1]CUW38464.1 protein of unknown function [Magnetospirillum sp. XM-1]
MSDVFRSRPTLDRVCLYISARDDAFPRDTLVREYCNSTHYEVRVVGHHHKDAEISAWNEVITGLLDADLTVFDLTPNYDRAGPSPEKDTAYVSDLVLEVGIRFLSGRPMILLLEDRFRLCKSFAHLDVLRYRCDDTASFAGLAGEFGRRLNDIDRASDAHPGAYASRPIFKTFRGQAVLIGGTAITYEDLRRLESAQLMARRTGAPLPATASAGLKPQGGADLLPRLRSRRSWSQ